MEDSNNSTAPLWATDAVRYVSENRGNRALMTVPIAEALAAADEPTLRALIRLSSAVHSQLQYGQDEAEHWIKVGHHYFPATAAGIQSIRALKSMSGKVLRSGLGTILDPETEFGKMFAAIPKMTNRRFVRDSRFYGTESSLRMKLDLDPMIQSFLPKIGTRRVLKSVLGSAVVGFEFDGDLIEEWREFTGACLSGTVEVLERCGISHDANDGDSECDSCGCSHENDESEEVTYCENFTIDEKMSRLMDAAGYLDSTEEWISEQDGGIPDWDALDEESLDETLSRCGPDGGDRDYDVSKWDFVPDLESMEGLEDLDAGQMIRITLRIGKILDACAKVGQLPPLPGCLVWRHDVPVFSSRDSVEFDWVPQDGTLSHRLSGTPYRLEYTPRNSTLRIGDGSHRRAVVDPTGLCEASGSAGGRPTMEWSRFGGAVIAL